MDQLPLDVALDDTARFESFVAGPNAEAKLALQSLARNPEPSFAWVYGPAGVGRSHLLQACVSAAHVGGERVAYLPLRDRDVTHPEVLQGVGRLALMAIDDVDHAAGNVAWERALLVAFDSLRNSGSRMVLSAARPPARCGFSLPDLSSRFASAPAFRLVSLSDAERTVALRHRADVRGIQLSDDVVSYLLRRVDRDMVSLMALLDRMDRQSLAAQRQPTVAQVRQLLDD